MAEESTVIIEGLADGHGKIYEFIDLDADAVNDIYVPGNQFLINGYKIKVAGNDPDTGVFFVPVNDPGSAIKVNCITENSWGRIIGIAPYVGNSHSRIEIRTQYAGSSAGSLKTPLLIISSFIIEEAVTASHQTYPAKKWRPFPKVEKVSGL